MTREVSAGGVVVRRGAAGVEVCLILRGRHGRTGWSLPKGHLEAGEDAADAARREVREETGVVGAILAPLGTIAYQFTTPQTPDPVAKTVSFFLMRIVQETGAPADATEVLQVRWVPLAEALRQVAYDTERQVLQRAEQLLAAGDVIP